MTENQLKLNLDKTEFQVYGAPTMRNKLSELFPAICSSKPDLSKNVGFVFDSDENLSSNISTISKPAIFASVRRYLNKDAPILLSNALVSSKLDYYKLLFSSLTTREHCRLQSIQNTMCRAVCWLPRRAPTYKHLKALHWLPVEYRIKFKTCVQVLRLCWMVNHARSRNFSNYTTVL